MRTAFAPVTALLIGTTLLYLGYGLQTTLVPLRATAEGFNKLTIGLLGSVYYAGFVAGCFVGPFVIQRAGHIRAFAAMVSLVSAAALAFPMAVGGAEWLIFRFVIGLCISGVLIIIESWLNDKATSNTRGMVMSAYIIVSYGAITIGQLGVMTQPLSSFGLFSLCSILLSVAAVPVALTRSEQPPPIPTVRFRPRHLWSLAPAAFIGAFVSGLLTGSVLSMAAVYAVGEGFDTAQAAAFSSAIVLGGALGQYPFGRTSDFVDRRIVLLVAAVATAALCLTLALSAALGPLVAILLGFGLGFVMLPTYALAAAHAYDWTLHEDMVETSASMNLLFGLGSTAGPIIASVAMVIFGPSGLFLVLAASAVGLVAFIAVRVKIRRRPAEELRNEFDMYSTLPVGAPVPDAEAVLAAAEDPVAPKEEEEAVV